MFILRHTYILHYQILPWELSLVIPDATLFRMDEDRGLPIYVTFDHISLILRQDSRSNLHRDGAEPWRPGIDIFLVNWAQYDDSPEQNFTIYASEVSKQWVKYYIASVSQIMENGTGTISLAESDLVSFVFYSFVNGFI